jgi:xanthine dehydrogenase accessory factor
LDLGARSGPEVALSIVAEIVQRRNAASADTAAPSPVGARSAGGESAEAASREPSAGAPATATDPVCGMEVEVATARWTSEYQGRTIVFCAAGCKRRFDREPSAFLEAGSASSAG